MCSRKPVAAELDILRPILGTWKGQGKGTYPTIEPFEYNEETSFSTNGKPFISYQQVGFMLYMLWNSFLLIENLKQRKPNAY